MGVETPEFTFEQEAGNVAQAIRSDGLRYPVVQDNHYGTWNAYENQYWPAEYLIDANGQVRHTQFGEGDYKQAEAAVRELLYEAGAHNLPPPMTASAIMPSSNVGTPETYLDSERAQGFLPSLKPGVHSYPGVSNPVLNEFGLRGTWDVTKQSATPTCAGRHDHAALPGRPRVPGHDLGRQRPPEGRRAPRRPPGRARANAGSDVHGRWITVRGQRLYSLVSQPSDAQHDLTVQVPPGVSAYDFTFG